MTKAQLRRKAEQILSVAVRLEQVINGLPPEFRDNNWKTELLFLIKRVERASQ